MKCPKRRLPSLMCLLRWPSLASPVIAGHFPDMPLQLPPFTILYSFIPCCWFSSMCRGTARESAVQRVSGYHARCRP